MIRNALLFLALSAAPSFAAEAPAPAPAATPAPAAEAKKRDRPQLLINSITPSSGVDPAVASALTDAVTQEVQSRGFFSPLSANDVQTLLGKERQAQLAGCSEEAQSCLAELAGALGARFVMSGSLAKLGEAYQLTLQTLDSQKATPVGRSVRIASNLETLQSQLVYAVAEATGTPLPPPPSRILPYSMIGVGALAVVGGGVYGLIGLDREGALRNELERGAQGGNLNTLQSYRDQAADLGRIRTFSLVSILAGAALIGGGILLNPPEAVSSGGGGSLALVPGGNGVAVVGSF